MNKQDKEHIMLRWGLTLKKILQRNKVINEDRKKETGRKDRDLIDSFGKLEASSGITKATLVNICKGRINAVTTTWSAILEALDMTLTEFAKQYDGLSETELNKYRTEQTKPAIQHKNTKSHKRPTKRS